jgi:hypothetical protein
VRLRNGHLTASAPLILFALTQAALRMSGHRLEWNIDDDRLVGWMWSVIYCAKPLASEESRIEQHRGQGEMYFEEAA